MASNKKKVSQIIDLTDSPPGQRSPLGYRDVVPQATRRRFLNGGFQLTTEPPMAISETRFSCFQHQPHHPVGLENSLCSTPDLTPSTPWQYRPSASIHGSGKTNKPTDSNKATQHSSYPTKLASDVLPAAGQHPTQQVLDAHLAGLKILFPGLNNYPDLLTLGLDPVDPDLPSLTKRRSTNMSTVNRPTYEFSDGQRPAHSTLKPALVRTFSDLHRVSHQPATVPYKPAAVPYQPSAFHNTTQSRNLSVVIHTPPKPLATKPLVFGFTDSDEESAFKSPKEPMSRGERPQRTRTPTSNVPDASTSRPKRSDLAMKRVITVPSTDPVQIKRARQANTSETATTSSGPKKRVRKPTLYGPQLENQIPTPTYKTFICEWKGCRAQLHNFETLQNHVFHLHNPKQSIGNWQCLWGKCGPTHGVHNNVKQSPEVLDTAPVEFETKAEWQDHINNAHLIPIAWGMGDGPNVSSLGTIDKHELKAPPRWLFDKDGNQITPSVEGQPIEKGYPEDKNGNRFAKKRNGLHLLYEPIMDPKLYWKMPDEQTYSSINGKPKHEG